MKTITYTLKDIVSYITDGKHGDCMDQDDSGFYFISSKDVNGDGINYQDARQITENDFLETNKRTRYEPNDILLTNSGTIGRMAIAKDIAETKRTTFQKSVAIIKPNKFKVLPLWLYYYLKTNIHILGDVASGAAQKNLLLKDIRAFKVNVPECAIQKSIIIMLSPYYDIIEKNNWRIQLLQESARLLFREWFVHFHFPGHEKVKLVDGVPEGWKREKLNKLVIFKRGVEPGSDNYLENNESGSFPFFRVSDLVTRNPSIFVDEQYAKSALLKKSDIVISLDGSIGIVSMGLEGCYSTGIRKLIIKDKKINRAYLYFLMKSHYVQGIINAYAKGTTIQHAGEATKHLNSILPPQNLMDLFSEITSPSFNEILILQDQNQKLAQARDLLLPRLMSGKIEV